MSQKISIVIPCYNESRVIGSAISQVQSFFSRRGGDYELIVVDDGSIDSTAKIALETPGVILLKNDKNRGKDYAVKKGILAARGDLVLYLDADMSTPISEIEKLLPYFSGNDIVVGSRAVTGAQVEKSQPRRKKVFGQAGNLLIKFILGLKINDTQCGFKMFKREALDIFTKQTIDRWGFDFELLFIAKKRGYRIKEVGVRWINGIDSKVTPADYLKTLVEVLIVRWNSWRGMYD